MKCISMYKFFFFTLKKIFLHLKKIYGGLFIYYLMLWIVLCVINTLCYNYNDEIINIIKNTKGATWSPGISPFFLNKTQEQIMKLSVAKENKIPITKNYSVSNSDIDIPESYDLRLEYPKCSTIGEIPLQGNCGCCWAFCTAKSFSDRLCIQSNGEINVNISVQHLATCETRSLGCQGFIITFNLIYVHYFFILLLLYIYFHLTYIILYIYI